MRPPSGIALGKLADAELLDGNLEVGARSTQSRRAFMKKLRSAGASVIPAVVSVSAPDRGATSTGLRKPMRRFAARRLTRVQH